MPLHTVVGLGSGNIVLDGGPASPPQKGGTAALHFSAHVYFGQTVGWIKKMPLGTKVGLGPDHIVLDGDPAPPPSPKTGVYSPNFRPMCVVAG